MITMTLNTAEPYVWWALQHEVSFLLYKHLQKNDDSLSSLESVHATADLCSDMPQDMHEMLVAKMKGEKRNAKNKISKCNIYSHDGILHGLLYDLLYHRPEIRKTHI